MRSGMAEQPSRQEAAPTPGTERAPVRPRRTKAAENLALRLASRTSEAIASAKPLPAAAPCMEQLPGSEGWPTADSAQLQRAAQAALQHVPPAHLPARRTRWAAAARACAQSGGSAAAGCACRDSPRTCRRGPGLRPTGGARRGEAGRRVVRRPRWRPHLHVGLHQQATTQQARMGRCTPGRTSTPRAAQPCLDVDPAAEGAAGAGEHNHAWEVWRQRLQHAAWVLAQCQHTVQLLPNWRAQGRGSAGDRQWRRLGGGRRQPCGGVGRGGGSRQRTCSISMDSALKAAGRLSCTQSTAPAGACSSCTRSVVKLGNPEAHTMTCWRKRNAGQAPR